MHALTLVAEEFNLCPDLCRGREFRPMSPAGRTGRILPKLPAPAAEEGDAAEPARPHLVKSIAGFIAWVTSSLAGIGAILYVVGYLSTVAQLHLLGLGRLVAYSNEHYLEEGGNFF